MAAEDANIIALNQRPKDRTNAERQRRYRQRKRHGTPPITPTVTAPVASPVTASHAAEAQRSRTVAALVTALALASVSAFFGVTGMTAIFAAAAIPVMVMVGVLEAAKLVTCAWLARHWRVTPLLLRAPLTVMVLALMSLTAIGSYGFF